MATNFQDFLETDCKTCNGTGQVVHVHKHKKNQWAGTYKCYDCIGGKVPSDLGAAVLEFIEKYRPWQEDLNLEEPSE